MNIDSLLNLKLGIHAQLSGGSKVPGEVVEVIDDDLFVFSPKSGLDASEGILVRLSDGQDSVLARIVKITGNGIRMSIECYSSPGNERRQDVRIYDRIYFQAKFLCHSDQKYQVLPETMERIRGNKLIIDSFLKGKYGHAGSSETIHSREPLFNQSLWELNRKVDLLIHMYLADDFMTLMKTLPRDVNISASGIRFITRESFCAGDLVEVNLILPMDPLLFMRLVGEVIRMKPVTSYETERYAVATRFLQIDPETKEDIIRYLFRRQRELLRKRQA